MRKESKNEHFMELYSQHHKDLSNFCQSLVWDKENAKELMSETISRAFSGFERIKDKKKFKSFVFSIASNVLKETIRKKANEKKALKKEEYSNTTSSRVEKHTVKQIIKLLPDHQAEVFVLFEVSDVSLNDISKILGVKEATVKTRLRRARLKLKDILEKEFKNHITQY